MHMHVPGYHPRDFHFIFAVIHISFFLLPFSYLLLTGQTRQTQEWFVCYQKSPGVTPKKTLAPEETFYEGPPAITETIAPTLSILTVVGIIPAAAAWARQAWVRYRITTRRIRVTSGINGKDMAEIVYPDIVEIRTARRVFGDGDLVAFLRDGANFEMRNIPNFQEAMDFILKQVDPEVAEAYRNKGDVTQG
jgi:hypothetical protein